MNMKRRPAPEPEPEEQPVLPMTPELIKTTLTRGHQVNNYLTHTDLREIQKRARGLRGGELRISFDEQGRMVRIRTIRDYLYSRDDEDDIS